MVDLSELAEAAASKDTKERLKAITDLGAYVGGRNAVDASSAPVLMEVLVPALGDNNLKVVQGALGTLAAVVDALEEDFAPFLGGLWAPLVERMGDAKAPVRERAAELAVAAATLAVPPAHALDRLRPAFEHRNWRARESALLCLGRTLAAQEGGGPAAAAAVKGCMPLVLTLLEDREPPVREAAVLALEQASARKPLAQFGAIRRNSLRSPPARAPARRRTATLATSSSTTCAAATCGRRSSSRCSSASASAAGARPRARRGTAATATAIVPTRRSGPRRRRICRCGRRAPAPAAACRVTAVARRRRWTRAKRWSRRWCTRNASFPKKWRAWVSC